MSELRPHWTLNLWSVRVFWWLVCARLEPRLAWLPVVERRYRAETPRSLPLSQRFPPLSIVIVIHLGIWARFSLFISNSITSASNHCRSQSISSQLNHSHQLRIDYFTFGYMCTRAFINIIYLMLFRQIQLTGYSLFWKQYKVEQTLKIKLK